MQTQQERIIEGFETSRQLHEGDLSVAHGLTNHEWRRVMVDDLYLSDAEADVLEAALKLYIAQHKEAIRELNVSIANYKAAKS